MNSNGTAAGAVSAGILCEIERLKAERDVLDTRITLLQAQLNNTSVAASTTISSAPPPSSPRGASGNSGSLTPEMIYRYSRHLLLPDFGVEGQLNLTKSSILVVGAGGLGSPVAMYLASCGVGCVGIVDNDVVEVNNLHRQAYMGFSDFRVIAIRVDPEIQARILDEAHMSKFMVRHVSTKMNRDMKIQFWWSSMKIDVATPVTMLYLLAG